ncbi:MAG: LacI family transcriptional regulator [Caldilinea sp. CFX5]|nr:LacI family transcriptional regulator [Caldilinea sp. CFX5]
MATIYDVAQAAGVSISTVSHVLNGTRFVSEETTTKVMAAVDQLNYRPSSLARAMVRQETRTIALIVPDNVNPFFAELARGIEAYGFAAGYNVILCNSDRSTTKELAYLDMLIAKRVDGVIYMTADNAAERLEPLRRQQIPVVTFDRDYADVDAIMLDNFQGGVEATRHLLTLGHRRIGCIAGPDSPSRSHDRVRGYQATLQAAGVPVDPALIVAGDWTYQSGLAATQQLLALPTPPTAIFACNDTMAIGVLAALQARQVPTPAAMSVVGFDNITLSTFVYPPLTTIATPILALGQQLCQLLLDRINEQLPAAAQRCTVTGQLIVRQSTAAIQ